MLLKSKIVKQQRESSDSNLFSGVDPLMTKNAVPDNLMGSSKNQVKGKIVVHRRINKTFAANTPE
jgi:hypothetical protein